MLSVRYYYLVPRNSVRPWKNGGGKAAFPGFGVELGPFFIGPPGNGIISILDAIANGDNSNFLSLRFFVVVPKPTVKWEQGSAMLRFQNRIAQSR